MIYFGGNIESLKIYVLAEDYSGYNSYFLAQHGISFLLETESNGKKLRILFDTATYPEPIFFNMKILNIDPKTINMIVLSHSHFDHTGGLMGIMKKIKKEVPIFAHPDIFKKSFIVEPEFQYIGIPDRGSNFKENIEKLGGVWILSKDPIQLSSGIFTLGEIVKPDRVNFEKNIGISIQKLEGEHIVQDEVEDEIGLGIVVKDELVVIGGCSHPGIISMIQKAVKISGINKISAVIGGFHLIDSNIQRIIDTVDAFKQLGVRKLYTGHCTGLKAESMLMEEFGERFEKLHSGQIIVIK